MKKYYIFFVLSMFLQWNVFAYDNKRVHPEITTYTIGESQTIEYLKSDLKVNIIVDTALSQLQILQQIKKDEFLKNIIQGSIDEDIGTRSTKHFYDPTTGNGIFPYTDSYNWAKFSTKNAYGNSSVLFSFDNAMSLLLKIDRENKLKELLYGLGHIVHLIEDCAVPAHVRNDTHLWDTENRILDFIFNSGIDRDFYEKYTFDDVYNFNYTKYAYNPVDITDFNRMSKFWDWNKGGAGGSAEGVYDDNSKGLAEFTNHNFVSRDTNIGSGRYAYPKHTIDPAIVAEDKQIVLANGTVRNVKIRYAGWDVVDKYTGVTEFSPYMATYSLFLKIDDPINDSDDRFGWKYALDDQVFAEQARFLIPRAVGYAAGFLNYFFRGQFSESPITVRPVIEDYRVTKYTWEIKNTSNYKLKDGVLKILVDDASGNRRCIKSIDIEADGWNVDAVLGSPIIIERNNANRPANPNDIVANTIYANETVNGVVMFRGIIGQEEGIAAMVGCPLINIIPMLQAIDEREFAVPEEEGFDMTWNQYSKGEDGRQLIIDNLGNLTGGDSEFDLYDGMDIDERIIGDIRFTIEEVSSRYWDRDKRQQWNREPGSLYKKANAISGEETGPGKTQWLNSEDEIKEKGVNLKDIIEIENCLFALNEAAPAIRNTYPGTTTLMPCLKKEYTKDIHHDIPPSVPTWETVRANTITAANDSIPTQADTGTTWIGCMGAHDYLSNPDPEGKDWERCAATLKMVRTYGRVNTAGLSNPNVDIKSDSLRVVVYLSSDGMNVAHKHQLFGSKTKRGISSMDWDLAGGGELSDEIFITGATDGWEYKDYPLNIFSAVINEIGDTYLAIYPEATIGPTSLAKGDGFGYGGAVGLGPAGAFLYIPKFRRYRNLPLDVTE